jgi:hypothetical protein
MQRARAAWRALRQRHRDGRAGTIEARESGGGGEARWTWGSRAAPRADYDLATSFYEFGWCATRARGARARAQRAAAARRGRRVSCAVVCWALVRR